MVDSRNHKQVAQSKCITREAERCAVLESPLNEDTPCTVVISGRDAFWTHLHFSWRFQAVTLIFLFVKTSLFALTFHHAVSHQSRAKYSSANHCLTTMLFHLRYG